MRSLLLWSPQHPSLWCKGRSDLLGSCCVIPAGSWTWCGVRVYIIQGYSWRLLEYSKNPSQSLKAHLACGPTLERTVCWLATGLNYPPSSPYTHTHSVYFLIKIIGPGLQVNCAFLLEKALIFYSFNSGALILSKWKHKGLTRAEHAIHLTSYCDVYLWRVQSAGTRSAVSALCVLILLQNV